jgi:hypothetical protein
MNSHPVITSILQLFLEAVGIPTVMQWKENARACNWFLTQQGSSRVTWNPLTRTLVPTPTNGSAHYKFLGRQLGELETILSQVPPAASTSASAMPVVLY